MSEENVEVVRSALTELNKSQQFNESWAPDLVFQVAGGPSPIEYRGRERMHEFLQDWVAGYDEWEQEIEDVFDAGGDTVVAALHQRGRLKGSEGWVDLHYGTLYTVERGVIRWARNYLSLEEALEAAGLS